MLRAMLYLIIYYIILNFSPSFLIKESHHNKWYWIGGEYVGIGPGAHGRFTPASPHHPAATSSALKGSPSLVSGIKRQARVQTLEPSNWCGILTLSSQMTRSYFYERVAPPQSKGWRGKWKGFLRTFCHSTSEGLERHRTYGTEVTEFNSEVRIDL